MKKISFTHINTRSPSLGGYKFAKNVEQALDDFQAELSPDISTQETAKRVLDLLNEYTSPVRIRSGEKEFTVTFREYFERISVGNVHPEDRERISALQNLPDFRLMRSFLIGIGKEAEIWSLTWEFAESVVRKILNARLRKTPSSGSMHQDGENQHKKVAGANPRHGKRVAFVSARRTEIENMMKPSGERPTTVKICKRLDFKSIPVEETWHEDGTKTWQEALEQFKNRVSKMISNDIRIIRGQDKQ